MLRLTIIDRQRNKEYHYYNPKEKFVKKILEKEIKLGHIFDHYVGFEKNIQESYKELLRNGTITAYKENHRLAKAVKTIRLEEPNNWKTVHEIFYL